jgi:two-component system LytT family response regulator
MKLKAIIVDDERLARKELRLLLADFDEINVIGEAENLSETVELIKHEKPDVVFLDIQLSNENGFDLLEKIEKNFELIFVTAFDEFAIRAFEINALDYLLKPVNPERLATAIKRLFEDEEPKTQSELRKLEIDDRLFLEVNERSCFLQISEISHIRASGDYTEVFMKDGKKSLIEKPLREWEERLPEKHFTRIHRSTIINLNEVEKIETLFNRTMEVYLQNFTKPFSVSRRFAAKLKEKFG